MATAIGRSNGWRLSSVPPNVDVHKIYCCCTWRRRNDTQMCVEVVAKWSTIGRIEWKKIKYRLNGTVAATPSTATQYAVKWFSDPSFGYFSSLSLEIIAVGSVETVAHRLWECVWVHARCSLQFSFIWFLVLVQQCVPEYRLCADALQ